MDGEDMTDDTEVEDIQSDMDVEMEGEMEESDIYGSFKDDEWYDQDDRSHDSNSFDFDYDEEEFEEDVLNVKCVGRKRWISCRHDIRVARNFDTKNRKSCTPQLPREFAEGRMWL